MTIERRRRIAPAGDDAGFAAAPEVPAKEVRELRGPAAPEAYRAAYNAGPARVLRAGGVPALAETRAYVAAIMDRLAVVRAASFPGVQP